MEHLALEIFDLPTAEDPKPTGSKYVNLPEDTTITITVTSEVFASGDVWSFPFTLNIQANLHIFGTAGELHGARLHELINKRRARLWVDGLPLYLGYLKLEDEVDVDENGDVDITFESGQKTFEQMIEGGKANQVPMMGDVLIGMALWRKREVDLRLNVQVKATIKEGSRYDIAGRVIDGKTIPLYRYIDGIKSEFITIYPSSADLGVCTQYPRMVFPKGVFANQTGNTPSGGIPVNRLNTDIPYDDAHPYCNIALCYQKHGYPTENGVVNYSAEEQALHGYETAPANRINSAPNFYVLYWLRCLMKHIGIHIEENQMMNVEDLRRLFFVNTNCAYEIPQTFDRTGNNVDPRYGCFTTYGDNDYIAEKFEGTVDPAKSKLNAESWVWRRYNPTTEQYEPVPSGAWNDAVKMQVDVVKQINYTETDKNNYIAKNRRYHYAYATSECFPNADVSEVIKAIENAFGVRFLFSNDYRRVRIVLLRNIFRSTDIQGLSCDILSDTKQENSIRGFRMSYGDKKDDTSFYYKGFADQLAKANALWADNSDTHDYSHWDLDADYAALIRQISAFDKTCYVTPDNGNAYGIKIDQNAKAYDDLHPSLFGFAEYMDAEDGDCTGDAETIEQIDMGFTPAIMNDVNFDVERDTDSTEQQFALFVSEEMRSRRPDLEDKTPPESYNDSDAVYDISKIDAEKTKLGLFSINSDMAVRPTITCENTHVDIAINGHTDGGAYQAEILAAGPINEGYRLYLQDNFEPNDDGVSPIETHDWGLTLGIMRGSGSDAYVNYTPDPDDGEENDTWDIMPGSSATAHPDTCDNYGREWDYNGTRHIRTAQDAVEELPIQFPDSNAPFVKAANYIVDYDIYNLPDDTGKRQNILMVTRYSMLQPLIYDGLEMLRYTAALAGHSAAEMKTIDAAGVNVGTEENPYIVSNLIVEIGNTSRERGETLKALCKKAYSGQQTPDITLDNGVGSRYGRFSLKLRSEKPNPNFDPTQPETKYDPEHPELDTNPKYLRTTNRDLNGRGLADQFYKEYSYWVRNARIAKITVLMELAQLLAIDKTVRVRVGDITGFIRKMQYTVSNKMGLGLVTMEVMYI